MSLWETLFGYSPRIGSNDYMQWRHYTHWPAPIEMQQKYTDWLNGAAQNAAYPIRKMVAGDLDVDHPFPLSPDGGPYRRDMVEGDL